MYEELIDASSSELRGEVGFPERSTVNDPRSSVLSGRVFATRVTWSLRPFKSALSIGRNSSADMVSPWVPYAETEQLLGRVGRNRHLKHILRLNNHVGGKFPGG